MGSLSESHTSSPRQSSPGASRLLRRLQCEALAGGTGGGTCPRSSTRPDAS